MHQILNCQGHNITYCILFPDQASVKVERKVGWFWIKIPCLDSLGSCHYKDVCELSPFVSPTPCPDPFPRFGLPCRCPVNKVSTIYLYIFLSFSISISISIQQSIYPSINLQHWFLNFFSLLPNSTCHIRRATSFTKCQY